MRKTKRWLALLLVAMMLLSVLPVSAMAASEEAAETVSSVRVFNSLLENPNHLGNLDLPFVSEAKLKAYPVSEVITALRIDTSNGETIVACGASLGDYAAVSGGVIDFSELLGNSNSKNIYFVVAQSVDQLNKDNKVYSAYVQKGQMYDLLKVTNAVNVTKNNGANFATDGFVYDPSFNSLTYNGQSYMYLSIEAKGTYYEDGDQVKLTLALKDALAGDYTAKVYKGSYATAEAAVAAGAEDITGELFDTGYTAAYDKWVGSSGVQMYTLVLTENASSSVVLQTPFLIRIDKWEANAYCNLYKDVAGTSMYSDYYSVSGHQNNVGNDYYYTQCYELYADLAGQIDTYYVRLNYTDADGVYGYSNSFSRVARVVKGYYHSAAEINAQPDIKDQVCISGGGTGGYPVALGTEFTASVLDTDGSVSWASVKLSQGSRSKTSAPSDDTYFTITGAIAPDGYSCQDYTLKPQNDSAYQDGYQATLLLKNDNSAVQVYSVSPDTVVIKPTFTTSGGAKAYASKDGGSATEQTSGTSEINFKSPVTVVPYSVKSESGAAVGGTRWVSFATQYTDGAYLFVNGATSMPDANRDAETGYAVRKVVLDDAHDNHHDIFFANIGNTAMTGISTTLDASGVKLDDYWKIGTTDSLDPFNNIATGYSEQENVGKLRLLPTDATSFVSIAGTLTISSANGGSETIKLTGIAGQPKILTESVVAAVKYVPYSSIIQTNYTGDNVADALTFSISDGSLPTGLTLRPTGEIYGVPTAVETKTFTVKITGKGDFASYTDTATFTMEVKNNTAANVEATTSTGYEFVNNERVPNMSSYTQQMFHSNGALTEFQALYLDGEKLTEGTDYTKEDGSTKITIEAQTFSKKGNGEHTLSAEFRTGGSASGDMKVTSQNYTASVSSGNSGGGDSGSGGNSGRSSDRDSSRDTTTPTTTPSATDNTPVEVKYEVTDGEATVAALSDSEVSRLVDQAADSKLVLDLDDPSRSTNAVIIPKVTVDKLADAVSTERNNLDAVEIKLSSATIELDDNTLEAVSDQAQGETVKMSVEEISEADLNDAQKEALEGMKIEKIVSAEISSNGAAISDFDGGRMTMLVPFTVPAGRSARDYAAYYVSPDGRKILLILKFN